MSEPIKGEAFTTTVQLENFSGEFVVNPVLVAGDVTVMTDFVSKGNIDTLPTTTGSVNLKVDVSIDEMTGDIVIVNINDVAGLYKEAALIIDTQTGSINTVQDIIEGDHIETAIRLLINKKGTTTPVLDKAISGSLLPGDVTIETVES